MQFTDCHACAICGKPIEKKRKFCSRSCFQQYKRKDRVTKQCKVCGKEFSRSPSHSRLSCCSMKCATMAKKGRPSPKKQARLKKQCRECGEIFEYRSCESDRLYCNMKCANRNIAKSGDKHHSWKSKQSTCEYCGQTFFVQPYAIETRRFCSMECRGAAWSGENAPNWKGGHDAFYGSNWKKQREKARERDGYSCQLCGTTEDASGRQMSVHHIVPRREFNRDYESANRLENLICLCASCHIRVEYDPSLIKNFHTDR